MLLHLALEKGAVGRLQAVVIPTQHGNVTRRRCMMSLLARVGGCDNVRRITSSCAGETCCDALGAPLLTPLARNGRGVLEALDLDEAENSLARLVDVTLFWGLDEEQALMMPAELDRVGIKVDVPGTRCPLGLEPEVADGTHGKTDKLLLRGVEVIYRWKGVVNDRKALIPGLWAIVKADFRIA
jgi:hypothetical protein